VGTEFVRIVDPDGQVAGSNTLTDGDKIAGQSRQWL
jgi:hypothetical protein